MISKFQIAKKNSINLISANIERKNKFDKLQINNHSLNIKWPKLFFDLENVSSREVIGIFFSLDLSQRN